MPLGESPFAQPVVGIRAGEVIPGAERDGGEVRTLLPQAPWAQHRGVGGIDAGELASAPSANDTAERSDPRQVRRRALGPSAPLPPRIQKWLAPDEHRWIWEGATD